MNKIFISISCSLLIMLSIFSFREKNQYLDIYDQSFKDFSARQIDLLNLIKKSDLKSKDAVKEIEQDLNSTRKYLKRIDFWARYLDPVAYRKINGPLPVEWETEVFEKFEAPYKQEGTGLTVAALYLEEDKPEKETLINLVQSSLNSTKSFLTDATKLKLKKNDHFFLANRLYLLNLSSIYTTGFECPDTSLVIPELLFMMKSSQAIYKSYNNSFGEEPISTEYLKLFNLAIEFIEHQPKNYSRFNHFSFISDYVNPLYKMNQSFIAKYDVVTNSFMDYTLNNENQSIFDKSLYNGQNTKGVFFRVQDERTLKEIENVGKLLFYDPILSGNNKRSCVSCHKPNQYFTDTSTATAFRFDGRKKLNRNAPSLINSNFNHLIMLDGKHISLQDQANDVIFNSIEMGSVNEKQILKNVLSCKEYKQAFNNLLKFTPQEKEIKLSHVVSALTLYYSKFSKYPSAFDEAMNKKKILHLQAKNGFNLFMSKAQCATCHFVPQFNGVKPPFVGSEFEVIGVPKDSLFMKLSEDKGRFTVNPSKETLNAFRTGSIRNSEHTKPYMHNGVFSSLNQVIDFYDTGGGAGKGLHVPNQTLSSDSLHLSNAEKMALISFIKSLNEDIPFDTAPSRLPVSRIKSLNKRKVGGLY